MSDRLESHWRLLCPSRFLCAADLRGRDVRVRIKSVSVDDLQVEGQDETKRSVIIEFEGAKKPWVAVKTNLRHIAGLHGEYAADWRGKDIVLHPTSREWNKKKRDWSGKPIRNPSLGAVAEAVRVWPEPPKGAERPPADESQPEPAPPVEEPQA